MIDIEKGNTSVYADLGMADAAEMQVKAILVDMVSEAIKYRCLSVRSNSSKSSGLKSRPGSCPYTSVA